jgi:hypothetical protein
MVVSENISFYKICVSLLIFIKIVFVILEIIKLVMKKSNHDTTQIYNIINYINHRLEFIFIIGTSLLIMYVFIPQRLSFLSSSNNNIIDYETRFLIFCYSFIIILSANWKLFIKSSYILNKINDLRDLVTKS